jgi:hypothetical protein
MPDALSAPSGCKRTRWIWGLPVLVALAASGAAAWQVSTHEPTKQLEKDSLLQQYEQRRRQLEELIATTRARTAQGDNDPTVKRLLAELAKVKEDAAARRRQLIAETVSTQDPTKQPEVVALLLVERVQPREDKEAVEEYRSTQAALVKSRLVLNAALRNPKVVALTILRDLPEPIEWLEDHLQVDFQPTPSIMRIGLSGKDPKEMCVLVDAVSQAYLDEIADKENKRRRDRLEALHEVARRFESKIKDVRASLRRLQEEVDPGKKVPLTVQGDLARAEYEKVKAELVKVRTELRKVKVEVEQAEKASQQGDTAVKQALAAKRRQVELLVALEKVLVGDAERLGREAKALVHKTLDLLDFQREVDEKEELLRTIQKQAAALEVELQAPARVKRIQEAVNRKKSGK